MFDLWLILIIAAVGLLAGCLGGMLGVGGSLIMIPAMVLLFGQDREAGFNQHLYQAAAMIVNVCVACPAALRHHKHQAIRWPVMRRMLPFAAIAILLGVWLSNRPVFASGAQESFLGSGPVLLGRLLGVFMIYVVVVNLRRLLRPTPAVKTEDPQLDQANPWRCALVGTAMGLVAGLLGIGGGAVAVPLQQIALRLPLRNCIANSSAVMCLTAGIGAIYKNATLAPHGLNLYDSLLLAALLAPTALIGGSIGGMLTHRLPLPVVRAAFIAVLGIATWKMLGL